MPRSEAKDLIEGYMATYPLVAEYMKKAVADAESKNKYSYLFLPSESI